MWLTSWTSAVPPMSMRRPYDISGSFPKIHELSYCGSISPIGSLLYCVLWIWQELLLLLSFVGSPSALNQRSRQFKCLVAFKIVCQPQHAPARDIIGRKRNRGSTFKALNCVQRNFWRLPCSMYETKRSGCRLMCWWRPHPKPWKLGESDENTERKKNRGITQILSINKYINICSAPYRAIEFGYRLLPSGTYAYNSLWSVLYSSKNSEIRRHIWWIWSITIFDRVERGCIESSVLRSEP